MYERELMRILDQSIHGIIFDLDGVLVDTAGLHRISWEQVCRMYGLVYTSACIELTKGVNRMQSLVNILVENRAVDNFSEDDLQIMCKLKNQIYLDLLESCGSDILTEDAIPLLEFFKNNGVKIGLASSSKNGELILKKLELERYFDGIITGNDISNAKPHPEAYNKCLLKIHCHGNNCIAVEDAYSGISSARQAGIHTIYIGTDEKACQLAEASFVSLHDAFFTIFK